MVASKHFPSSLMNVADQCCALSTRWFWSLGGTSLTLRDASHYNIQSFGCRNDQNLDLSSAHCCTVPRTHPASTHELPLLGSGSSLLPRCYLKCAFSLLTMEPFSYFIGEPTHKARSCQSFSPIVLCYTLVEAVLLSAESYYHHSL